MDFKQFVRDYILSPYFFLFMFWALAWIIALVSMGPLIGWLKRLRGMKWSPREDTPDSHLQKAGTPSMGGLGILGAAIFAYLACLIFFLASSQFAYSRSMTSASDFIILGAFPLFVALHAVLGFVDDWSKARGRGGLLARQKLLGQILLAGVAVVGLALVTVSVAIASRRYSAQTPPNAALFVSAYLFNHPWLVGTFLALVLIATSNAVNITDGIDGLAAGLSVQVALVFTLLYFSTIRLGNGPLGVSATLFWPCLGGACLGFLAFNKYPAKVFMGDTGSLALGAALGAGAILTHSVFLLPFIGFIFWVEMFSVIAQVAYFKYTKKKYGEGKRIFRRAPLHHHFELGGWSEWRVVGTFWAVNALTTLLGLMLWKAGVLPRFP